MVDRPKQFKIQMKKILIYFKGDQPSFNLAYFAHLHGPTGEGPFMDPSRVWVKKSEVKKQADSYLIKMIRNEQRSRR